MAGFAGAVRAMEERVQPVPCLDKSWGIGRYPRSPDQAGVGGRNKPSDTPTSRSWPQSCRGCSSRRLWCIREARSGRRKLCGPSKSTTVT